MQNALALYTDNSPGDTEELNRLIDEMERSARHEFTEDEIRAIKEFNRGFGISGRLIDLPALEVATGYSKERLSMFRNGQDSVPDHLVWRVRRLHHLVLKQPGLVRVAVLDWLERHTEPGAVAEAVQEHNWDVQEDFPGKVRVEN